MFGKNVRMPVGVLGDLNAQMAACHIGEGALTGLICGFDAERLQRDGRASPLHRAVAAGRDRAVA